jgi:ferredoxin-NADP reductase/uncharacterized iron-regulated membrane protein
MSSFKAPVPTQAAAPKALSFAGLVRSLHHWCGLTVGLLLVVVAFTGASMAFRAQIEPVLSANLLRVPACSAPLPPSRIVALAQAANPDSGPLAAIRMYGDPQASTRVRFGDGRWVYVDPCSGRILGIQAAYGGVFGTLAWVHTFGYLPAGATVAGVIALFALVMAVAGVWLWWRERASRRSARHRRRPGLTGGARKLHLHRSLGPWCAPILMLLAITGTLQAFPALSDALQAIGKPETAPARQLVRHAATTNALDAAWRQARATPWQQIQWRIPAGKDQGPITAEITAAGAPHAYAAGIATYDPHTGTLLQHGRYEQAAPGRKAWLWALALHYGAVGEPVWQLALFLTALSVPVMAWTGIASYLHRRRRALPAATLGLQVRSKRMEAEGVCSFELVHPRGRKLPPWTPGAHIDVHIAPGLLRQYSLCGDPRDRSRYLIAVQRSNPSRGGSSAMHALHEGERVQFGLPRNNFPLADGAVHTVLLAGGIGITPLIAMAEALATAGASFELHYCARSAEQAAFLGRLGVPQLQDHVHFHFSSGSQRVDMDKLLSAPGAGTRLYICGSGGFTDAALAAAVRQGWPADAVSTERFAPAQGPAAEGDATGTAQDRAFDLVIASSGRVVHVPAECSALDALLAAGITIPSSCRQGLCGTCISGVLEGEPDHRDHCLSAAARAANDCFTPCCSRARGEKLVLDL